MIREEHSVVFHCGKKQEWLDCVDSCKTDN